jgi:hypothetical protein
MSVPHYDKAKWSNANHATVGERLECKQSHSYNRVNSYGQPDSSVESPKEDDDFNESSPKVPVHDQRTVLITNLPERATHRDLCSIIRGGRLLDVFLRNDRTATISFVEGAAEFLAYAKRKDIYLHTKRVSSVFRPLRCD